MNRDDPTFRKLYPFRSNYFEVDGNRMHYLDEGEGPVMVMLHGNPTWSFYYRNLVSEFRSSHRVIVPDHMGCGFSDKPQDYAYTLENHVKNVTALLAHLKVDSFTLVVHDWGGPIGFGYAVENPDAIERFVVFNSTCFLTTNYPFRIRICRTPLLGEWAIRGGNFFSRCAASTAPVKGISSDVRSGFLMPYDNWQNRIANLRFVQDIPMDDTHPTWWFAKSLEDRLERLVDKPMLMCWGEKDFCFTPAFRKRWEERFPKAQSHPFEDAGHYVVEDALDRIIPLMHSFLEG